MTKKIHFLIQIMVLQDRTQEIKIILRKVEPKLRHKLCEHSNQYVIIFLVLFNQI